MKYEAERWKEQEGPSLRNFDETGDLASVNGALALRPQIEKIIDQMMLHTSDEQLVKWMNELQSLD